jgi:hypothetical protein
MILSILHLVVAIRAALRSYAEGFLFGMVGGFARAAMMIAAFLLSFQHMGLIMLPGLTLRGSGEAAPSLGVSLGLALVVIGGPILSFAVLWAAWRRFQDVPAAQEEKLKKPFGAWLPVGILDAAYLLITIAAIAFAMGDG